jgi:hypothetical protein
MPRNVWPSKPPNDCPFPNSSSIKAVAFTGWDAHYTKAEFLALIANAGRRERQLFGRAAQARLFAKSRHAVTDRFPLAPCYRPASLSANRATVLA